MERNPYFRLCLLCHIDEEVTGVVDVLGSYSLAVAVASAAEAFHQEHALNISLRLSSWIVIDDSVYLLIREIDGLDRNSLRSEYLSECRTVNILRRIVLTYHRLDGGAYGLCGVWSVVLLDLLKEVTEVVVSDVFPQWLVAQQLIEHSHDLDELRILPDISSIEGVVPPRVTVIVGEPTLLDSELVLLLLNRSQQSFPVSCLDF